MHVYMHATTPLEPDDPVMHEDNFEQESHEIDIPHVQICRDVV